MKYRKKPIIIEAVKFEDNADCLTELSEFFGCELAINYKKNKPEIIIKTLEGLMAARVGDYIIKGVKGEFYPCKADIFEMTYELVK